MIRPFVEFYRKLGISPVRQDLSDLTRHLDRRDALYRHLGIPPGAVRGARVIEFGPGSGANALHTAVLRPGRYVLVDANPRAIADMRELFAEHGVEGVEIVESMIEDLPADPSYDLVLAEGFIPYSAEPERLAQMVGAFAAPGALLVITCADAAAALGEIARRAIAWQIAPLELAPEERVTRLLPIFEPHLRSLHGMSRSHRDWILDNIVHPFTGRMFSLEDAARTLGDAFDPYATSPDFVTDWRWYKTIHGDRGYGTLLIDAFRSNVVNLLDYRNALPPHDPSLGQAVLAHAGAIYDAMQRREMRGDLRADAVVAAEARGIARLVRGLAPATAASFESLAAYLDAPAAGPETLEAFVPYFGRGMQYLSLIRRP